MIIWGSGGRTVDLGVVGSEDCKVCERQRPFHLYLSYEYSHLYWIFRWVTEKEYLKLCEICRRGWQLDTKQVEAGFQENPIPFMDRLGCRGDRAGDRVIPRAHACALLRELVDVKIDGRIRRLNHVRRP